MNRVRDRPLAHLELQDDEVLTGAKLVYRVINDGEVPLTYPVGPLKVERWSDDDWTVVVSPEGWWVPFGRTIEPGAAGPWMTLEVSRNGDPGKHQLTKTVHAAGHAQDHQASVRLRVIFTVVEDPARI